MEVHIGKKHSDLFDCGLCATETKSLENLNIHLSTCEMYKCEDCDLRLKSLSEIKKHVETKHFKYRHCKTIIHLKQNRSDPDAIDEKPYESSELFPEFLEN